MTTHRSSGTGAAARVTGYLDDLARMLADVDPATRDDVLAGVREHLDATLAEHPDDPAAIDAALLRLGPPERVAAAARADLPPATIDRYSRPGAAPAVRHPRRARIAGLTALVTVGLPASVSVTARATSELVAGAQPFGAGPLTIRPTDAMALTVHSGEVLGLLPLLFPVWVVAVVVALLGPDLLGRTKAWLVLLGPAMSLAVLTSVLLADPGSFGTPVSLVALGAVLVGIVLTGRRVWRETRP